MNNDDLDKLIKRSLNNVAENITLSDPIGYWNVSIKIF